MLGFYAMPMEGKWVITRSSVAGLKPGDIIRSLEGQSIEALFQSQKQYVSASDERWLRRALFECPYLFPPSFNLTLEDGRSVPVVRNGKFQWPGAEAEANTVSLEEGVLYIRIPSFDKPIFEDSARKSLRSALNAAAVIIDVRGNHGGSTPSDLVADLMDRPYRWYAEATPVNIGLFQNQGFMDQHAELAWFGTTQRPGSDPYRGDLYLLVDGGCFSACEDFLVPFKDNHRATIIGARSAGSSGQPVYQRLADGMGVQVSAKREYLPDGSAFEGVGVAPDIEVTTTIDDLRRGRDPVLAKAGEVIRTKRKP
jgi:carboxyl-terminal processing protease